MQYFYYTITLEFHPLAFVPPSYIFPHPLLPEFLCCSFSSPKEAYSYTVSVTFCNKSCKILTCESTHIPKY